MSSSEKTGELAPKTGELAQKVTSSTEKSEELCVAPHRCWSRPEVDAIASASCAQARSRAGRADDYRTDAAAHRQAAERCAGQLDLLRGVDAARIDLQRSLAAEQDRRWLRVVAWGLAVPTAMGLGVCIADGCSSALTVGIGVGLALEVGGALLVELL